MQVPKTQTLAEFEAMVKATVTPYVSKFGRVRWNEIDAPGPTYEYLIDGWLSVGDKSVVGGPSRSGKSFLSIHMAMCIARGKPFFGREVRQGLVVYQAGEGARGVRRKRLPAYRKHHRIPSDETVPFELLTSQVDLYRPDGDTKSLIEEILAIAAEYPELPLAAVFIDTLATATGGADENSGRDMGTVMKNIALIEHATGAHVVLVHHMNAAGTKLRGHTSIYANVDQVILVTRDEETKVRTAFLDKQKDDEDGLSIKFELKGVEIGEKANGDPISSCVCLPLGEKVEYRTTDNQGWTPNAAERNVLTYLFEAKKRHGMLSTDAHNQNSRIPVGTEIIDWKDYLAVANELKGVADDGSDEEREAAIRKEFSRAYPKLFNAKVLGLAKPYMWWAGRPVRGFASTYPKNDNQKSGGELAKLPSAVERELAAMNDDDLPF